jgi:hypothetical protein
MKKLFKIGLFSLFIASSCLAATTNAPAKTVTQKVAPYSYYNGYKAPQTEPKTEAQKQTTNVKIVIEPQATTNTKVTTQKIKDCQLDEYAPIAPHIDYY